MAIHATIMLYNDRCFLTSTLESVKDCVDSIIICDGAYQQYYEVMLQHDPQAKPWSTDGSLELVKLLGDLPDTTIIHPPNGKPWQNQLVKRKAMLDAVPDGDWFLGIDADELILGRPSEAFDIITTSGCIVGQTPLYHVGLHMERLHPFWHPRIFQKTEGMHYRGTHWQLRDKYGRIIENEYPIQWTDKAVIAHLKAFKPRTRLDIHEDYLDGIKKRGWIEPFQTATPQ